MAFDLWLILVGFDPELLSVGLSFDNDLMAGVCDSVKDGDGRDFISL
jgi:hypothetical protein